ncbi:ABC transporter ATP-binding protein, partial [Staphylococcus cohnii]
QQRVGVVRALAADPPVILMDEPYSALDPISREKLQDDLIELQQKIKKTIIFVTHDIQEAMKLGDRICLLNEGRVEQIDTPEGFIKNPKNDFVKQFMGDKVKRTVNDMKLSELVSNLPNNKSEMTHESYPVVQSDYFVRDIYEHLIDHEAIIVDDEAAST